MSINTFLGNLLILFGFIKIIMYFFRFRLRLARLELLTKKYGEKRGVQLYFLVYAMIPIALGVVILLSEKFF